MLSELRAQLDHERMLSDLLAVIHRDGGQRQEAVGTEQAWMEAMMLAPIALQAAEAVEVAREALGPFAQWAEYGPSREYMKGAEDEGRPANTPHSAGDYRKAAAALATLAALTKEGV